MEPEDPVRERASASESEKPVSELTGEQALAQIWERHLYWCYSENKDLFHRWWKSLPTAVHREVAAVAEMFRSFDEYQRGRFSSPGSFAKTISVSDDSYESYLGGLPSLSKDQYVNLVRLSMEGKLDAVAQRIEHHVREYRSHLKATFGVREVRGPVEEERDRWLSSRAYLLPKKGSDRDKQLAKEWKKEKGERIDPETIKQAIRRFRKGREQLAWGLRVWIYSNNFPPLESLSCTRCEGSGEIPAPTVPEAIREWYIKGRKVHFRGLSLQLFPPYENPADLKIDQCPDCGGSGRRTRPPEDQRSPAQSR